MRRLPTYIIRKKHLFFKYLLEIVMLLNLITSAENGKHLAKINEPDKNGRLPFYPPKLFTTKTVLFNSLGELYGIFSTIAKDLATAVVHGDPIGELKTGTAPRNAANFEPQAAPCYLCLDVDKMPLNLDEKTALDIIGSTRKALGFDGVGVILQYTATTGSKAQQAGKVSFRLWFMLDTPAPLTKIKAWVAAQKSANQGNAFFDSLDSCIYTPERLILTANLDNKNEPDPRPRRWYLEDGKALASAVFDNLPITQNNPPQAATPQPRPALPKIKKVTIEEAQALLKRIDSKEYPQWLTVGMGLHHQYTGGADGFKLWDDWSRKSPNYDAGNMRYKWDSFKDQPNGKPVTFDTIRLMARGECEALQAFLARYVYVTKGNKVVDLQKPPSEAACQYIEFKNTTANIYTEEPDPRNPEKTTRKPVSTTWLHHPQRQTADSEAYDPAQGRLFRCGLGLSRVNTFHLPPHKETDNEDQLALFFAHMEYLFPIKEERDWFIDWLAFNVQRPAVRCKVTPLHVTTLHGTGRGWVVEAIGKLLGAWNCTKTKMATLVGEGSAGAFNDYLDQSLVCCVEEVKEKEKRYEIADNIRDTLTENELEVNKKHKEKRTQKVYTNFFFMSNHPDALALPKEDRRINVLSGPTDLKPNDYYTKLYQWLKGEGVAQLFWHLKRRDISQFNWQRSMHTHARAIMIESTTSELEKVFLDFLEGTTYTFLTTQQVAKEIQRHLSGDIYGMEINGKQVLKLLQKNCSQIPKQIKADGRLVRVWQLNKSATFDNETARQSVQAFDDAWRGV